MGNDSNQSSDVGAFLAGFVIGGLVGAAVALILAPRSGEEIRSQLIERGEEFRNRAREYGDDYLSSTKNRLQDVRGEVKDQVRIVLDEGKQLTEAAGLTEADGENAKAEEDNQEAS